MPKPSPIADTRRTATLNDWYFVQSGNHTAIRGTISGDSKKRFKDGDKIVTSKILRLDFENAVAITRKSTYILGIKKADVVFLNTSLGM